MASRPFPWHALHDAVRDRDASRFARVVRGHPERWQVRDPWGRTVWMIALAHDLHGALPWLLDERVTGEHLRQRDAAGRSVWDYLVLFPPAGAKAQPPEWLARFHDALSEHASWDRAARVHPDGRGLWARWMDTPEGLLPFLHPVTEAWGRRLGVGMSPADWWGGVSQAPQVWRQRFMSTQWCVRSPQYCSMDVIGWANYWADAAQDAGGWRAQVDPQPWLAGWCGAMTWLLPGVHAPIYTRLRPYVALRPRVNTPPSRVFWSVGLAQAWQEALRHPMDPKDQLPMQALEAYWRAQQDAEALGEAVAASSSLAAPRVRL